MSEQAASAKAKAETGKTARSSKKTSGGAVKASLNIQELRELAELVNEHGFTDFEFENENIRVRLSKQVSAPVYAAPAPQVASPAPIAPITGSTTPEAAPAVDEDAGLHKITSPIVGTFYRSPAPDKPSYVSEGSVVSPESVVCIVEAMKLMNEIQAETSGEIVKIYVENGAPVEYGQPLFGIRK